MRKPSSVPSFLTATSVSWNQRSLPCDIDWWKSVRHSVHWTARPSLRASRQHATSCGCDVILLPKPPPMSCVTKRSLSSPVRIAGPIMIAAKPGNWLFVWIVHCPVPRLYSTRAPFALERRRVEAVEVQLVDLHDLVGLGERGVEVAPLVDAFPHQVAAGVLVDRRHAVVARVARVGDRRDRLVLDLDELRGVARELARLGDDRDDRLADVAHLADRERVVLDVAAGHRRDLEERIGERRDLFAGQRPVDARRSSAFETSIDVMCACAYGERTKWM